MERADLLEANGAIFKPQGEAIAAGAADDIKVLVVGNPANTNALIAQRNADGVPRRALHRDDAPGPQPRGRAARPEDRRRGVGDHQHGGLGQPLADDVPRPVQREGRAAGARGTSVGDESWVADEYIPRVGKRGAEIIEARGASSAASAANAAIDHVRDWVDGTAEGDWVSMAVPSDGSYGVEEGIISSFPVPLLGRRVRDRPGPGGAGVLTGSGSTRRSRSSREREAVKQLGLV